jgi:enamine deaminase RidA (YjgF/YER057c/UK114 family)
MGLSPITQQEGAPMGKIADRIHELGLALPPEPEPLAQYVPAKRAGDLVMTSGQVPARGGEFLHQGTVGENVSTAQAQACARQCVLNALAAVRAVTGTLDAVAEVVSLRGFVASGPGFYDQPEVLDAASELLVDIFGESGKHVRSAVGVNVLPRNLPVELELTVQVTVP